MSSEKKNSSTFQGIIGKSQVMKEVEQTVNKVAIYKTTVLIVGESGTGKELLARAIHDSSDRKHKKFVAVNCGAIPEHLMESELFGHKKGSFTDATKDKRGLFEEASGGTLFLDEIGELPLALQAKLLRALQEEAIRPVGSETTQDIDVRVIAATLRDLEQDSINGKFRDDLFYRLNVLSINLPPLRERMEDLADLIDFLLDKICARLGMPRPSVKEEALEYFKKYTWPGNIRELENYLERATILSDDAQIGVEQLPEKLKSSEAQSAQLMNSMDSHSIKENTKILEEHLIRAALKDTSGNKTKAAKLLEISHRTLLYKMKEYEIE